MKKLTNGQGALGAIREVYTKHGGGSLEGIVAPWATTPGQVRKVSMKNES